MTNSTKPVKRLFVKLSDFANTPPNENWVIYDYLMSPATTLMFGESGKGKSFVAIDMSLCIASGRQWHGNDVEQGAVIYMAGEGRDGIKKRFQAWTIENGLLGKTLPFYMSEETRPVTNNEDMGFVISEIDDIAKNIKENIKLIVIDTLNRHFGEGNENDAGDMGKFINAIDGLRDRYKCCVLIVHHSGVGDKSRGRGSSALKGALDQEYMIDGDTDLKTVKIVSVKQKDSDDPPIIGWHIERIELIDAKGKPFIDRKGRPYHSAVLRQINASDIASNKTNKLPTSQKIALEALRNALIDHGEESKGIVSVSEDHWRDAAYEIGISKGTTDEAKRIAFIRAVKALIALEKVDTHEGRYWVKANRTNISNKHQHF